MKTDKRALLGAVLSVGASAATLFVFQGIVASFVGGGVFSSFVPYFAGCVAALLVLKTRVRILPEPQRESEIVSGEGTEEHKVPASKRVFVMSASLILLLGINFAIYFASGGGEARAGRELIFSAALGVFVKPPIEEILFRYLYLSVLTKRGGMGLPYAVVCQGVLFALWHKPESFAFALLAGIILGTVAAVSHDGTEMGFRRGCADAVIVHALHNLILYVIEGCVGH